MLVKICGISDPDHARRAVGCGADWVGMVFVPRPPSDPRSKRVVSVETAKRIVAALSGRTEAIGLFQNQPTAQVVATARAVGLTAIQLHGQETADGVEALLAELPSVRVLKAFGYTGCGTLEHMLAFQRSLSNADRLLGLLLDGPFGGGTGRTFDWSELGEALDAPAYAGLRRKLVLAGGLSSQNVERAIRMVRPMGVDVSSGVESSPGVKDPKKIEEFIRLAKAGN
ncbi:MAG: phosphoribosylanthranilate isomerase [Phycisphaerae bacterium]|nr:phosphoribosylanthranilate isomerase [Phycisphaerae bacterium]